MTQDLYPDIDPLVEGGTSLAAELTGLKNTLETNHSGPGRPTYALDGLLWTEEIDADKRRLNLVFNGIDYPIYNIDKASGAAILGGHIGINSLGDVTVPRDLSAIRNISAVAASFNTLSLSGAFTVASLTVTGIATLASLEVTGNISVGGTVDGVDVGALSAFVATLNPNAEQNPLVIPQLEAESGTSTTLRLISGERLKQAILALAPSQPALTVNTFTSLIPFGAANQAHGLAAVPNEIGGYMVCTSAEAGYAVADRVPIGNLQIAGSDGRGVNTWANATNIGYSFQDSPLIVPKGGGNTVAMDLNKWDIVITSRL